MASGYHSGQRRSRGLAVGVLESLQNLSLEVCYREQAVVSGATESSVLSLIISPLILARRSTFLLYEQFSPPPDYKEENIKVPAQSAENETVSHSQLDHFLIPFSSL